MEIKLVNDKHHLLNITVYVCVYSFVSSYSVHFNDIFLTKQVTLHVFSNNNIVHLQKRLAASVGTRKETRRTIPTSELASINQSINQMSLLF